MDCQDFRCELDALVVGILSAQQAAPLEAHAEGCPTCKAVLVAEEEMEARLREALCIEVPSDLPASIKARMHRPRRLSRWGGSLALAAGLLLGIALWPAPAERSGRVKRVSGEAWLLSQGERRAVTVAADLHAGDQIVTDEHAEVVLEIAGAEVRVAAASAAKIARIQRGPDPEIELRRGSALFTVVSDESDFEVSTPLARVRVTGTVFRLDVESEPTVDEVENMNLSKVAWAGITGVVTAVAVTVIHGAVTVENEHGRVSVQAGHRAGVTPGAAPRPLRGLPDRRIAQLEAELKNARAEIAENEEALRQLRDKVGSAPERRRAEVDAPPVPRDAEDVRLEIVDLARTDGLGVYGAVEDDHPLLRELEAMGPPGIALLATLLRTGNDTERFVAAALLEKLDDPAAIPALEEALFGDNHGNILIQRMASHALGKIGGEAAIPVLERTVAEGAEWGIRTNAAYSLAQMGRESGIDWLLDAYRTSDDAAVRGTLLGAMGRIGDRSYVPELHRALKEETEYSRRITAVGGIINASQASSLPVLEALIADPDEDAMIVHEAKKAYNEISQSEIYPLD